MKLILSANDYHQIIDLAIKGRPQEVCGSWGWDGVVHSVWPMRNAAADTSKRYLVDPRALVEVYQKIERAGDELIGIYHSHPLGEPFPSLVDIAEANWPDAVYVIVGFAGDDADLRGWSIVRGKVTPAAITLR